MLVYRGGKKGDEFSTLHQAREAYERDYILKKNERSPWKCEPRWLRRSAWSGAIFTEKYEKSRNQRARVVLARSVAGRICSSFFSNLDFIAEAVEPADFWFAVKPGQLALGVVAVALLWRW